MKRIAAMAWVGSIPLDERQRVKENPDYPMRDRLNLQIAQHTLRQGGKVTPEPQMVWYSTPWDRFGPASMAKRNIRSRSMIAVKLPCPRSTKRVAMEEDIVRLTYRERMATNFVYFYYVFILFLLHVTVPGTHPDGDLLGDQGLVPCTDPREKLLPLAPLLMEMRLLCFHTHRPNALSNITHDEHSKKRLPEAIEAACTSSSLI